MKTVQTVTDRLAIGLSLACTMHCLATPALLVLLPSLTALQLDNEAFHFCLVFAVIPTSLFAITLCCKQHNRYQLFVLCSLGLAMLFSALILEERIGETGEKLLTVLGSSLIVIGHWLNYRLCRKQNYSDCVSSLHEKKKA